MIAVCQTHTRCVDHTRLRSCAQHTRVLAHPGGRLHTYVGQQCPSTGSVFSGQGSVCRDTYSRFQTPIACCCGPPLLHGLCKGRCVIANRQHGVGLRASKTSTFSLFVDAAVSALLRRSGLPTARPAAPAQCACITLAATSARTASIAADTPSYRRSGAKSTLGAARVWWPRAPTQARGRDS